MRCLKCDNPMGYLSTNDSDFDLQKTMGEMNIFPICLDCLESRFFSYKGAEK